MSKIYDDLYLDTSIQIDRKIAEPEKKEKLENILSQAESLTSSSYVKMEYRRSLVRDWVFIFNAVDDVANFGEVLLKVNTLPPLQQRRIRRMIGSIAKFFFDVEQLPITLGKELIEIIHHYFKTLIEFSMEDFNDSVNIVSNETDCYIAKGIPRLKGKKFDNRITHCKPGDIKCDIVEFFQKNIESFKKIYDVLSQMENLDDEQKKIKKIIEKALKHPKNMADFKNCWNCGDSIIAVECPNKSSLLTKNLKHFEPLCKSLKKHIVI